MCPDTLAASYLDGYQSGYTVYLTQLEVDAMERSIETKSGELERIWSQLDAVASDLEQTDIDAPSHVLWIEHSHALMARQTKLNAEIDELESEIAARKAQMYTDATRDRDQLLIETAVRFTSIEPDSRAARPTSPARRCRSAVRS